MTLYRYDLLFKDMVSGVTGVGSIIQLEAIPASTCLNLKEHKELNDESCLANAKEDPSTSVSSASLCFFNRQRTAHAVQLNPWELVDVISREGKSKA